MKYITANDDVFLTEFKNDDCSLSIRSGQQGEVEISSNRQEIAQIGMSFIIDAAEQGEIDADSLSEMILGMEEPAITKTKELLQQVLEFLEEEV